MMRKRGISITLGQVVALLFAILAIVLVFRFTPYYNPKGLMGDTAYFLSGRPPREDEYMWHLDRSLQCWELSFIGLTLCAALIAFGREAEQSQSYVLIGLALEVAVLGCILRSTDVAIVAHLTWLLFNVLAAVVLFLVFMLGRRAHR